MKQQALGMIETKGLVPAIEAGDAGVKAANVTLLGYELVKGGLVMVAFTGEVAAVKASVEAGSAAAARVGQVISEHVIPRPEADLRLVFKGNTQEPENNPPVPDPQKGPKSKNMAGKDDAEEPAEIKAEIKEEIKAEEPKTAVPENTTPDHGPETTGENPDLASMTVGELRKLARKTPGISIHGREISRANKEQLIEEIRRAEGRKD